MKTFEQFLQELHALQYHGTDDDMPDAFDNWLGGLDGADYINFGDAYGKEQYDIGQYDEAKKHNPTV